MELRVVRVPQHIDTLNVLLLGDCHAGHRCFREDLLDSYLGMVGDDWRILILGDLFELATRKSPGRGMAEQVMNTQQQREFWTRKLDPVRHLIVGAVAGNHEERQVNEGGDDMMAVLCAILGVHYFGYVGVVAFATDKTTNCAYSVAMAHGASGAMLPGGAMNAAMRRLWNVEADIYVSGHVHKPTLSTNVVEIPDLRNRKMTRKEQLVVTNGALLVGGYAEMKGYPAAKPCQGILRLSMDGHRKEARCDL